MPGDGPPGVSLVRAIAAGQGPVLCVATTSHGRRAVSGGEDGTVRVWDLETAECLRVLGRRGRAVRSVALAGDGRRALSGGADCAVRVWDLATGECHRVLKGHRDWVRSVGLTADGRQAVSGGNDGAVRVWDPETGECLRVLEERGGRVWSVALAADGRQGVSGGDDGAVRAWDLGAGECVRVLEGHASWALAVALTGDGRRAASGGRDGVVRIWEPLTGRCLRALEGHRDWVRSVALTADGGYAVSGGSDGAARLWDLATGECLHVLEGSKGRVLSVALTTDGRRAVTGGDDGAVRVWDLDWEALRAAPAPAAIRCRSAKVVLLGETGVGKTGLFHRLTDDAYVATTSTRGMSVRRLELPSASAPGLEREAWLWDLTGQPDYRLPHQPFLDQTGVALVVVDPQADDPFAGVGERLQALRGAVGAAGPEPVRLLIAGRADVGGMRVSQAALDRFARDAGFAACLPTSARTGFNCSDECAQGPSALKKLITDHVPWEHLPETSADRLLREMRRAIVEVANRSGSPLVPFAELHGQTRAALPRETIGETEMRTAVTQLAGQSLIRPLSFGDLILLQPAVLSDYAAAVLRQARANPDQLGSVSERDVVEAKIDLTGVERLPDADEALLLRALVETLLNHALCLREEAEDGARLVFPSQCRRRPPRQDPEPDTFVTYAFTGELMTSFATLVVRLWHTRSYERREVYRNAAEFLTPGGRRIGLVLEQTGEGAGRLRLYADPRVAPDQCCVFAEYVHRHLQRHSADVTRERRYRCPACREPVGDSRVARMRLERGRDTIACAYCEATVPLLDAVERCRRTDAVARKVGELDRQATLELESQAMQQVLTGQMMVVCAAADQVFRRVSLPDRGVDGEIEFSDERGQATGARAYVQLDHGVAYRRRHLRDEAIVFDVKSPRHLELWQRQPGDVYLALKTDDDFLWMNVTRYLRTRSDKQSRQIIFQGERLDAQAVLRLRSRLLRDR